MNLLFSTLTWASSYSHLHLVSSFEQQTENLLSGSNPCLWMSTPPIAVRVYWLFPLLRPYFVHDSRRWCHHDRWWWRNMLQSSNIFHYRQPSYGWLFDRVRNCYASRKATHSNQLLRMTQCLGRYITSAVFSCCTRWQGSSSVTWSTWWGILSPRENCRCMGDESMELSFEVLCFWTWETHLVLVEIFFL